MPAHSRQVLPSSSYSSKSTFGNTACNKWQKAVVYDRLASYTYISDGLFSVFDFKITWWLAHHTMEELTKQAWLAAALCKYNFSWGLSSSSVDNKYNKISQNEVSDARF
jgi:hypothetical protein